MIEYIENKLLKPRSIEKRQYQITLADKCFKENLVDLEKYHDFSNERRQSVLAYDQEWLDKLIYYHSNWIKLISNNNDGFLTNSFK